MDEKGFPGGSDGKESLQCRRPQFDPEVMKISGEGNSNLLQYSCLENPMDGIAWGTTVCGVAKGSDTTEQLKQDKSVFLPGEFHRGAWRATVHEVRKSWT